MCLLCSLDTRRRGRAVRGPWWDSLSVWILTWFGTFVHGAVVNLVFKLGSVVVHVDDEDVEIDGVFHLVPVHVHGVGS